MLTLLYRGQALEKQHSTPSRRRRSRAAELVTQPDDGDEAPGARVQAADPYEENEDESDFEL